MESQDTTKSRPIKFISVSYPNLITVGLLTIILSGAAGYMAGMRSVKTFSPPSSPVLLTPYPSLTRHTAPSQSLSSAPAEVSNPGPSRTPVTTFGNTTNIPNWKTYSSADFSLQYPDAWAYYADELPGCVPGPVPCPLSHVEFGSSTNAVSGGNGKQRIAGDISFRELSVQSASSFLQSLDSVAKTSRVGNLIVHEIHDSAGPGEGNDWIHLYFNRGETRIYYEVELWNYADRYKDLQIAYDMLSTFH